MKIFKNANVLVHGEGIKRVDLAFEESVLPFGTSSSDAEEISLPENAVVLPGFIDEHIHGAGGADAMDGTDEALTTIATMIAKEGTTGFCATTMTCPPEEIERALSAADTYAKAKKKEGAELLGVHLEGPFISAAHKGAQPLESVAKPSKKVFDRYWKASGGRIRIVTLAPEEKGALPLISALRDMGIVPSIGHTGAKYADIERAVKAGARGVTHTYNAQSPLHHREIGTVGSALLLDELYCELICDTVHVSVPAIKLLFKCKGWERVTLITDAMRAKAISGGVSELGGQTVYVKNGEARLADGTLAGSVLKMNVALKNLVEKVGLPLEKAAECATLNPARNLGLQDRGVIAAGKRADFAVLDPAFNVICTYREGREIYRA